MAYVFFICNNSNNNNNNNNNPEFLIQTKNHTIVAVALQRKPNDSLDTMQKIEHVRETYLILVSDQTANSKRTL